MRFVVTWVSLVCLFFSAVYAIRTPSESSTNNLPLILHANGLDESGQKAIAMLIQAMLKEKEQWPPTSLAALKLTFIPSRMEDEGSPADGVTTFYVSGNFANCLAGCKGLVDQEGKGQAALVTSGEPVYTSEGSTLRVYPVPEARQRFSDRLRTWIRNARQKSDSRPSI